MKSLIDLKKIDLGSFKIQMPKVRPKPQQPEQVVFTDSVITNTETTAPNTWETPPPVTTAVPGTEPKPLVLTTTPEETQVEPTAPVEPAVKPPIVEKIDRTLNYWLIAAFIVAVLVVIFQTFNISIPNTKSLITREPSVTKIEPSAKVLETSKYMVTIELADGSVVKRTGGSLSWRLHNPGRLSHGKFTKSMGAIGDDGRYAVFLTEAEGRKANKVMLFEDQRMGFSNLTILQAVEKYAPETIGGKPLQYAMVLAKAAGTKTSTLMRELNEDQREKVLDAIQVMESYTKGYIWNYKSVEEYRKQG